MGGEYGMLSLVAYEDYAALEKEVERLKGERLRLLGYISGTTYHINQTPQEVIEWWEGLEDRDAMRGGE